MGKVLESRPSEKLVNVYYCDRCDDEIPAKRERYWESDKMLEGTSLSSRSEDWEPLIPIERVKNVTHNPQYTAAHVDICGPCLESLREWFAEGWSE